MCPRYESNVHLFLRTELFYPLNYEGKLQKHHFWCLYNTQFSLILLLFYPKQLYYLWLVESDNNIVVNKDNWYSHLATFLDHLLALLVVFGNVKISKCYVMFFKEVFCHMTKVTSWCAIYSNCVHIIYRPKALTDKYSSIIS
ncbi:MAG: hypothetical protein QG566_785 [Patescibacteria group bacterium]|nr:hypothetical protein [Patescibacteria group bacterium]